MLFARTSSTVCKNYHGLLSVLVRAAPSSVQCVPTLATLSLSQCPMPPLRFASTSATGTKVEVESPVPSEASSIQTRGVSQSEIVGDAKKSVGRPKEGKEGVNAWGDIDYVGRFGYDGFDWKWRGKTVRTRYVVAEDAEAMNRRQEEKRLESHLVVCLPSICPISSREEMRHLADILASAGHQVIAVEWPGFHLDAQVNFNLDGYEHESNPFCPEESHFPIHTASAVLSQASRFSLSRMFKSPKRSESIPLDGPLGTELFGRLETLSQCPTNNKPGTCYSHVYRSFLRQLIRHITGEWGPSPLTILAAGHASSHLLLSLEDLLNRGRVERCTLAPEFEYYDVEENWDNIHDKDVADHIHHYLRHVVLFAPLWSGALDAKFCGRFWDMRDFVSPPVRRFVSRFLGQAISRHDTRVASRLRKWLYGENFTVRLMRRRYMNLSRSLFQEKFRMLWRHINPRVHMAWYAGLLGGVRTKSEFLEVFRRTCIPSSSEDDEQKEGARSPLLKSTCIMIPQDAIRIDREEMQEVVKLFESYLTQSKDFSEKSGQQAIFKFKGLLHFHEEFAEEVGHIVSRLIDAQFDPSAAIASSNDKEKQREREHETACE